MKSQHLVRAGWIKSAMLLVIFKWYLVMLGSGAFGFWLLVRCGFRTGVAWAGGRVIGLALITLVAWWLGWSGIGQWLQVGIILFVLAVVWSIIDLIRRWPGGTGVGVVEVAFFLGFVFVLLIRIDRPEILNTEKFMDLGILTSLLRSESIPPPDFWLSGVELSYYYWGALLWTIPAKLSHIETGTVYNLIVATIGGMVFSLTWFIGKTLSNSNFGGLVAVFFCAIAGTYDGFQQFLVAKELLTVDMWRSTRLDETIIMEFPLFTLWLGDLHSHLLVMPLVLSALLLGLDIYITKTSLVKIFFVGGVCGLVLATNPWSYPATLVVTTCLVLFGPVRLWPNIPIWREYLMVVVIVTSSSILVVLPFLSAYTAPVTGLGWVNSGTSFPVFSYYAGILFVPVIAYALIVLQEDPVQRAVRQVQIMGLLATTFLFAALIERPVIVLSIGLIILLIYIAIISKTTDCRIPIGLSVMAIALFLIPEFVYVVDVYGNQYYRANTVFKFYYQSWILLSLALSFMVLQWIKRKFLYQLVLAGLVVVASVHPLALLAQVNWNRASLDGYQWMTPTDRAITDYLTTVEPDATLLESMGAAYSSAARFSVTSGVSSYLGWPQHQFVWRGSSIGKELQRREQIAGRIYSATEPAAIRNLAIQENINYIAIGSMELERLSDVTLNAIRIAGELSYTAGQGFVIRIQ